MKHCLRASNKIKWGPAARHFGRSLAGTGGASPRRAVTTVPTTAPGKRAAAQRVFAPKAVWRCCDIPLGGVPNTCQEFPEWMDCRCRGEQTQPLRIWCPEGTCVSRKADRPQRGCARRDALGSQLRHQSVAREWTNASRSVVQAGKIFGCTIYRYS